MEHVSGIIQSIMGTIACPTCEATDQEGGPVPDATDRKRWLDTTGLLVTCPMCDNGEIYWEEHSPYSWEARREDCEHCDGSGELTVHDRCETCGRLEQSCGKGPKRVAETDRLHDHLS